MNKTDCDTADNKQENFEEISNEMKKVSNKMTSWREYPQHAENDGANGTDGTNGTNEMTENEYD